MPCRRKGVDIKQMCGRDAVQLINAFSTIINPDQYEGHGLARRAGCRIEGCADVTRRVRGGGGGRAELPSTKVGHLTFML